MVHAHIASLSPCSGAANDGYTRSSLQDSRLFGPSPWKILSHYLWTNGLLSNPAPGENLVSGNLVMETGCSRQPPCAACRDEWPVSHLGRGDDTIGSPHRTQISQFECFELILVLKLDKQFPAEQFEATVSQSTVPSPPLSVPAL